MDSINALQPKLLILNGGTVKLPEGNVALRPIARTSSDNGYGYDYFNNNYLHGIKTDWQLNGEYSMTGSSSNSASGYHKTSGSSTYRVRKCYSYKITESTENPDFDNDKNEGVDNQRTIRNSTGYNKCNYYTGYSTTRESYSENNSNEIGFTIQGNNYTTKPNISIESTRNHTVNESSFYSFNYSLFNRLVTLTDQQVKALASKSSVIESSTHGINYEYTDKTVVSQSLTTNSEYWVYETLRTQQTKDSDGYISDKTFLSSSTEQNIYWRKVTHHTSTKIPSDYLYKDNWSKYLTTTTSTPHVVPRQSNGSINIINSQITVYIVNQGTQETIYGDFYDTEYGDTSDVYASFEIYKGSRFIINTLMPLPHNHLYGTFEASPGYLIKPYYSYIQHTTQHNETNATQAKYVNPDELDSFILYNRVEYTPNTAHKFEFKSVPVFSGHNETHWKETTIESSQTQETRFDHFSALQETIGANGMHALYAVKSTTTTEQQGYTPLPVFTNSRDFWTTDYAIYTVSDNEILTFNTITYTFSTTTKTTTEESLENKTYEYDLPPHAKNTYLSTICDFRYNNYGCETYESFQHDYDFTVSYKEFGYNLTTTWQKLIFHKQFVDQTEQISSTKLKSWPAGTFFTKNGIDRIYAETLTASLFLSTYPKTTKSSWSNEQKLHESTLRSTLTQKYGREYKTAEGASPPRYMWYENKASVPTVLYLQSESSHYQRINMLGQIKYKYEEAQFRSYPHKINALNEVKQCTLSFSETGNDDGKATTSVATKTFSNYLQANNVTSEFTEQIIPYKAAKIAPNILYSYHSDKRNIIFYYNTFGSQVDRFYSTGGIAQEGTQSMVISSSAYIGGYGSDDPIILEKTLLGEPVVSSIIAYSDFSNNYNFSGNNQIKYDYTGASTSSRIISYQKKENRIIPVTTSTRVFSTYAGIAIITDKSYSEITEDSENATGTYTRKEGAAGTRTVFGVHKDTIRRIIPYATMPGTFNHEGLFSLMTCVGFTKISWSNSISVSIQQKSQNPAKARDKLWGKYFYHKPDSFTFKNTFYNPVAPKNWAYDQGYKNNNFLLDNFLQNNRYAISMADANIRYDHENTSNDLYKNITNIGSYEWIANSKSDIAQWANFDKYFTFYGKNNAICTFLGRSACPKSWDPEDKKWKEWDLGFKNEPETGLFYYTNPILSYAYSREKSDRQTKMYASQHGKISFKQKYSTFEYSTKSNLETFEHGEYPVILSPQTIVNSTTSQKISIADLAATYYIDQKNPIREGVSPQDAYQQDYTGSGNEIGAYMSFVRTSPALQIAQIGTQYAKGAILDCIYQHNGMLYETPAATAFKAVNKYCNVVDGDEDLKFEFNLLAPARKGDLKVFVDGTPLIGSIGIIKNGSGKKQEVVVAGEGSVVLLEPLEFDVDPDDNGALIFGSEFIDDLGEEHADDAREKELSNEEFTGNEDDIKSVHYAPPQVNATNFDNTQITNNSVNFGFESNKKSTKTVISIDDEGTLYKKEVNTNVRVTYKITNANNTKVKESPISDRFIHRTALLPITFTKQMPYTSIVNVNKTSTYSSIGKTHTETTVPENISDFSRTTSTTNSRRYFYIKANTGISTSSMHNGDTHDLDTVFARVTTNATVADEVGDYTIGTYSNAYTTLLRSDYNTFVINSPTTSVSNVEDEIYYLKHPDVITFTHTAFLDNTPTVLVHTNIYRTISGIEPYMTTEYKTLFSSINTFQPTASASFKFQKLFNTFSESIFKCETETYLIPWGSSNETYTVHCSTKEIDNDEEDLQKYNYFYNLYTNELNSVTSNTSNIKSINYTYNKFDTNGGSTGMNNFFTDFINPENNPFYEDESQFVGEWMLPEHFTFDGRVNPENDYVIGISPLGGPLQ